MVTSSCIGVAGAADANATSLLLVRESVAWSLQQLDFLRELFAGGSVGITAVLVMT